MIREDHELLVELYRLNAALTSLALRIMDGSASAREQVDYAQRLTRAGQRLRQRAVGINAPVEGEILVNDAVVLPMHTVKQRRESGNTLSHEVRQLPSKLDQLEAAPTSLGMPRRVSVKGMEGVPATVVVRVVQDKVWLSISPPFTWEAIMDPAKVDELMHVLELATDEARQVSAARHGRASHGDKPVVRVITSGLEA